jgi:hypothetical protein
MSRRVYGPGFCAAQIVLAPSGPRISRAFGGLFGPSLRRYSSNFGGNPPTAAPWAEPVFVRGGNAVKLALRCCKTGFATDETASQSQLCIPEGLTPAYWLINGAAPFGTTAWRESEQNAVVIDRARLPWDTQGRVCKRAHVREAITPPSPFVSRRSCPILTVPALRPSSAPSLVAPAVPGAPPARIDRFVEYFSWTSSFFA